MLSQFLMKLFRRRLSNTDRPPTQVPIPDPPVPSPTWPSKAEFELAHVHTLVWADLIAARDELSCIWNRFNDHRYAPPSRHPSLAQRVHRQISWKTHSPYSYPGPSARDIIPDYLFYVKAYRHCLGQLIDIFQLRGDILDLYNSRADAPVSVMTSLLVVPYPKFQSGEIFEQLKQKLAVMTFLVTGLVHVPPEYQPQGRLLRPPLEEVVDVHDFEGMGRGVTAAIKPRLLADEVWASRVCYLAGLGVIEDMSSGGRPSVAEVLEDE